MFLCVKQMPLRDVSFTPQKHFFFIELIKKVHTSSLFLIPVNLKFILNKRVFKKNRISYCRIGFVVYSKI